MIRTAWGEIVNSEGPYIRRAYCLGSMGIIIYEVDDADSTVLVSKVVWMG